MTEPAQLLESIRGPLRRTYGERLQGVVLYGSAVRRDLDPDSDIDVLVLLDDVQHYGREVRVCLDALYELSMTVGRRLSLKPVTSRAYEEFDCPLFRAAHREGIAA